MIFLVCGVPGSGKTWVLKHFTNVIHYDAHFSTPRLEYAKRIVKQYKDTTSFVVADCPLGISEIMNELLRSKVPVTLCAIIEAPEVVTLRYFQREGKSIPKQHLSRIKTIVDRCIQYKGVRGTSQQILEYIQTQLNM